MKVFFAAAAVLSIVISLAIILSLVGNALTFFINVDKASLWTDGWFPRRGLFDIKTIVVGTLVISAVAMLVATPLGLGAGIYLSEYASPRVRRSLKPIIEILASIPSVVLGFFALTWISPNVIQTLDRCPALEYGGGGHCGRRADHAADRVRLGGRDARRARAISVRRATGSAPGGEPPRCRSSCRPRYRGSWRP